MIYQVTPTKANALTKDFFNPEVGFFFMFRLK